MEELLNPQEIDLLEIYRNYSLADLVWTLENVLPYIDDPWMTKTILSLLSKLEDLTQQEYEKLLLYCFGLQASDGTGNYNGEGERN